MMKKIGITGGIGSGKSTVCKVFSLFNVPVYDADSRAKFLMANDDDLKDKLIQLFGDEVFEGRQLNRKLIAAQVFNSSEKLIKLNAIVHPRVGEDFESWTQQFRSLPFVIKEAALMFESDSYKTLDSVITVFAPEQIRIQRVLKRDVYRSESDIRSIISNQFSEEQRRELASFTIINDDKMLVIPQVLALYQLFSK